MPKLFITGGTGYIGTCVASTFQRSGFEVHALARSQENEKLLRSRGITPVAGELKDAETISAAAAKCDVVIHTAADYEGGVSKADKTAVEAILNALSGSGKPFIYTSGIWVLGSTKTPAKEDSPTNPIQMVAWRVAHEQEVLAAAAKNIRTVVLRPGIVYGNRGGIVRELADLARKEKQAHYINSGENFWPVVHVEDLADLYLLVSEKAPAGSLFHATNPEEVQVREVVSELARVMNLSAPTGWTVEQATALLGGYVEGLVLDQRVDSSKAREQLGWRCDRPDIAEDIRQTFSHLSTGTTA